jgi:hypothetical protein
MISRIGDYADFAFLSTDERFLRAELERDSGDLRLSAAIGIIHIPSDELQAVFGDRAHKLRFELLDLTTDLPEALQPGWLQRRTRTSVRAKTIDQVSVSIREPRSQPPHHLIFVVSGRTICRNMPNYSGSQSATTRIVIKTAR